MGRRRRPQNPQQQTVVLPGMPTPPTRVFNQGALKERVLPGMRDLVDDDKKKGVEYGKSAKKKSYAAGQREGGMTALRIPLAMANLISGRFGGGAGAGPTP
tara:strand:+ start:680 stop:982 length:303 start_codon:yes stop_codon:yes gene_type:complete